MKTKRLLITIAFFFFALTYSVDGQVKQIILNVDIENISSSTVKESCYFEGQNPGDNPGDFVTVAKVGDNLEWEGRSIEGYSDIWIHKIIRIYWPNIFYKEQIENRTGERIKRANIKIATGRTKNKNIRNYINMILFIIVDENQGKVYVLDPLIRSHN